MREGKSWVKKVLLGIALFVVLGVGVFGFSRFGRVGLAASADAFPAASGTGAAASPAAQQSGTAGSTGPSASSGSAPSSTSVQSNATVGALTLTAVTGARIVVNPAQKTVLHFMTSSCSECLPTEIMLAKFQHAPGVQLISIDVQPQTDTAATIAQFSRIAHSHWPYVLEGTPALVQRFHITALDTVIVLYHNSVVFSAVAPSRQQLAAVLS